MVVVVMNFVIENDDIVILVVENVVDENEGSEGSIEEKGGWNGVDVN